MNKRLQFSINEFQDNRDKFGLLSLEPETTNYLTYESEVTTTLIAQLEAYPSLEYILELSQKKHAYARSAYTLFILAADVGGFNASVIIFPALLMGYYSSKMYEQSIASEIPVKKKKYNRRDDSNNAQGRTSLIEKLRSDPRG